VFKLTLDTSCLLAIDDPATGPDIIRLINLALGGAATIALTSTVAAELPTAPVTTIGKVAVTRLEMFPVLGLSGDERLRRDALRDQLLTSLFPNATGGSATWRHDRLDCEHLAAHLLRGRDLFVTLDKPLLRKASTAREAGIELLAPDAARMRIEEAGWTPPQQPEDLVIRLQRPADDAAVTAILQELEGDYPDFRPWLFRQLGDPQTVKVVGELGGSVGAVAFWKFKERPRVAKLSAFRVADSARHSGLGSHLLFHLTRSWVEAGTDYAYVTLSTRHSELVSFFGSGGFLIEGVAAQRYRSGSAEIVMGKHLLRREVADADFASFAEELGQNYFGLSALAGGAAAPERQWFLPPLTVTPTVEANAEDGRVRFLDEEGRSLRTLDPVELETIFYPVRLRLARRRALLIPIQPQWAERMMAYPALQPELPLDDRPIDRLLLRRDNAYYCFPRCERQLTLRAPIVFYVSDPVSACVGEARVLEHVIAPPEVAWQLFGDIGVYTEDQIRGHVQARGAHAGEVLALRVGLYLPFSRAVPLPELRRILRTPGAAPQGLTPISTDAYAEIRAAGGLSW
jgi:predicted transcriptional regulator